MKLSQFTVVVNDDLNTDHHLLYHTLSRAMISIDREGWTVLQKLLTGIPAGEKAKAFLSSLQAQGFLVPSELSEGERYLSLLRSCAKRKGGLLSVTWLTNQEPCPLACVYCYQKGVQTGGRLEGEILDLSLAFIKGQCLKLAVERLYISYYGSEPLQNKKAMVSTATSLKEFCEKKGIHFRFGMVTSGVLLTRKVVEELLPLGFVHAQITIDGNSHTHDAARPFRNGKGTYALIMKNFQAYAGLISTTVLCVLDSSRLSSAYELIKTLAEKGYAEKRVRVTFSPVMPTQEFQSTSAAPKARTEEQAIWAEKKILVSIAKLKIDAAEKGLYDDLRPKQSWCAMLRHDGRHFTLDPSGRLYTCPAFIGREEKYAAGHIREGFGGIETLLKEQYTRSPVCLSCRYLPICGDCRYDALCRTGEILWASPLLCGMDRPESTSAIYEKIVPQLMKAHYRLISQRRTPNPNV